MKAGDKLYSLVFRVHFA